MTESTPTPVEAVYRRTDEGWEDVTALLAGAPQITPLPGAWPAEPRLAHAELRAALPWARCVPPYRQVRLPWAIPPWPGVHLGDWLTVALLDGPFAGIVTHLTLADETIHYVELLEAGAAAVLRAGWDSAGGSSAAA